MATDKTVNELVINKLTQAQYDAIPEAERSDTELYFITDADSSGKGAQVEEMPEATEMNAGQIVQYVGKTILDAEATAIITQTVGDSLTDLKVDAKKFGKASGLTKAGSLEFNTTGSKTKFVSDELPTDHNQGITIKIDSDKFFGWSSQFENIDINTISQVVVECDVKDDSSITDWGIEIYFNNDTSNTKLLNHSSELPEDSGISYEVAWLDRFGVWCRAYFQIAPKTAEWFVDNQVIDINQYGITYSGIPISSDTLKVDYTPFVSGYEKGYFYVNQAQLSEPTITIEQTVGGSLSDLSIDIDKFIKIEQPASDCEVEFKARVEKDYGNVTLSMGVGEWIITVSAENFYNTFVEQYGSFNDWQYSGFIVYYHERFCFEGQEHPNNGGFWFTLSKEELEARGFQFSTNSLQELDYNTYEYIAGAPDTVVWLRKDTEVDIANYGIYYSGIVNQNDIIKVNYIAPKFIGYGWNQINVQPASKGNGGIEWVTKLDLPADYPEQYRWYCFPIWTIPGDVPDGTYEFYVQSLCGTSGKPENIGMHNYTVKVLVTFYTEGNNRYHVGSISYVLDGTWTGDSNFVPQESMRYDVFKKGNNNLYFWSDEYPFRSSLPGYVDSVAVPGIFKISAWKNIDSGETYIPEGMLYTGGELPSYEESINGYLDLQPLCPTINYPSYYVQYKNVTIDENRQYARIYPEHIFTNGVYPATSAQSATFEIKSKSGGTFYATIKNKNGVCIVQELESFGDLENTQLGIGNDGYSYIYFNNNDLSLVDVSFSLTSAYDTSNSASISFESWVTPSSFTPLAVERVGAPITIRNLDKVLQYMQESTDEYTQGYFYKAVGDIINVPENVVLIKNSESDFEISLADDKDIISILSSIVGWPIEPTIENLKSSQFVYYYGAGNPRIWYNYYGDIYDQELLSCFNVIPELEAPEGYPSSVEFTLQYTPASQKIENGRWEQVDVQPASGGDKLPDQTDNAGKFLMTDGTIASWGEALVNNNAEYKTALSIGKNAVASSATYNLALGYEAKAGVDGNADTTYNIAIGAHAAAGAYVLDSYSASVAVGHKATVRANGAILISAAKVYRFNDDDNTFAVANNNGTFRMMDANGNVPLERLTYVTNQIGDISTALSAILGE